MPNTRRQLRRRAKEKRRAFERLLAAYGNGPRPNFELLAAQEELKIAKSAEILYACDQLDIPVPSIPVKYLEPGIETDGEYWTVSDSSDGFFLTTFGVSKLKKKIHEARSRQLEVVSGWVKTGAAFLGACTGIVGAIIGLISILKS